MPDNEGTGEYILRQHTESSPGPSLKMKIIIENVNNFFQFPSQSIIYVCCFVDFTSKEQSSEHFRKIKVNAESLLNSHTARKKL